MKIKKIKNWLQGNAQFEIIRRSKANEDIFKVKRISDGMIFTRLNFIFIANGEVSEGFGPTGVIVKFHEDQIRISVFLKPDSFVGDGSFFEMEINEIILGVTQANS